MMVRFTRAVPLLAAAAVLPISVTGAGASIVAPIDPEVAASLFVDACWAGLHDEAAFRRAIRSSSLEFHRVEDAAPGEHYGGRRTRIDYFSNASCTVRLSLLSAAAAEEVLERIAGVAVAPVSSTQDGLGPRTYRWAEQPVSGGRMSIEAQFTPPRPQRRFRMYPEAFTLSISAYFTPNE